jgi:hypothetical protein
MPCLEDRKSLLCFEFFSASSYLCSGTAAWWEQPKEEVFEGLSKCRNDSAMLPLEAIDGGVLRELGYS